MASLAFCRFEGNNLVREDADIYSSKFIAISHVWVEKECAWTTIPGVPFEVLVSPQKAEFIKNDLRALVGDSLFWMDVLVVDQRKDSERLKVVKHIPAIYRNAVKTIVIREDNGFKPCCAPVIEKLDYYRSNTPDPSLSMSRTLGFLEHLDSYHPDWASEVWVERLWPLQEASLSRVIQFTVCKSVGSRSSRAEYTEASALEKYVNSQDELDETAKLWANGDRLGKDIVRDELVKKFKRAVICGTTVSRGDEDYTEPKSALSFLSHSTRSPRRTGKARDFVLALFPSYDWYKAPQDIMKMRFGDLWADCLDQLATYHGLIANSTDATSIRSDCEVKPRLTLGVLGGFKTGLEFSGVCSPDIPEPVSLGDFCNLFYLKHDDNKPVDLGNQWQLSKVNAGSLPMGRVLELVSMTLHCASQDTYDTWRFAWRYSETGTGGNNESLKNNVTLKIVDLIWGLYARVRREVTGSQNQGRKQTLIFAMEWQEIKNFALSEDSVTVRETLLRLAALLGCKMGRNSLEWSNGKLEPYELRSRNDNVPAIRMAVLGAVGLDRALQGSDELGAFGVNTPYVVVRSPGDGMQPRIIGLTPDINEAWRPSTSSYDVEFDDGCPYALAKTESRRQRVGVEALAQYHLDLADMAEKEMAQDYPDSSMLCVVSAMADRFTALGDVNQEKAERWRSIELKGMQNIHGNGHESTLESFQKLAKLFLTSKRFGDVLSLADMILKSVLEDEVTNDLLGDMTKAVQIVDELSVELEKLGALKEAMEALDLTTTYDQKAMILELNKIKMDVEALTEHEVIESINLNPLE